MATFLASPTQAEEVATDPVEADGGILKMLWRLRGQVNNLGYTVKDVVDEQNKSVACLNNTFKSIADWAIKTEDRLASLESRGGGGGAGSTPWIKSISEVKAIQNLEQL